MREIGVNNWIIIPLLTFSCDKKTIRKFEREWCNQLNADHNSYSPFSDFDSTSKEYFNNYRKLNREKIRQGIDECHKSNIQNKKYHCSTCDKSFRCNHGLKKHFGSLNHSYAYMNSLD